MTPSPVTDTKEGREMTDNSGAAFPHPEPRDVNFSVVDPGLTKREYFAGQALAGLMAQCKINGDPAWRSENVSRMACRYADALIAALGGKDD